MAIFIYYIINCRTIKKGSQQSNKKLYNSDITKTLIKSLNFPHFNYVYMNI